MRYTKTLFISLLAVLVQGCASVLVEQPIGVDAEAIVTEEWQGTWFNPGGSLTIHVIDHEQGLIDIAWIETKDERLKMESRRVVLKRVGEWVFGSLKTDDRNESDGETWLWGRIKKEPTQITFWVPDPKKFKTLVADGTIPGRIKADDVILGKLKPAHLDLITSEQAGLLYLWDSPMVLMRLGANPS